VGRIFQIDRKSNLSTLSVALCQLLDSEFANSDWQNSGWAYPMEPLRTFLGLYKSYWDAWHVFYLDPEVLKFPTHRGSRQTFHYHLRLMSASRGRPSSASMLNRDIGSIHSSNILGRLFVCEKRISVAVRTTFNMDLPVFSQVVLGDFGISFWAAGFEGDLGALDSERLWSDANIRPSIRLTAISAFAFRLHGLLSLWFEGWLYTLAEFKSDLRVNVRHPCRATGL
jgi:hypothetical protein